MSRLRVLACAAGVAVVFTSCGFFQSDLAAGRSDFAQAFTASGGRVEGVVVEEPGGVPIVEDRGGRPPPGPQAGGLMRCGAEQRDDGPVGVSLGGSQAALALAGQGGVESS